MLQLSRASWIATATLLGVVPIGVARADCGLLGPVLHGRGGAAVEYVYTGEVFTNLRGGLNTNEATEYRGNFDLTITADLERMGLPPGGTICVYGQTGHGRGLTERHVGDFQVLSNIDAPDFVQVSEYWWEKSLCDGRLRLRLGKQDANADFAVVDLATDFINSSFGFHPTIPMPTFPDPSMAAVVFWQMADPVTFQIGVWDGAPHGGNWGFSGRNVTFTIAELKLRYNMAGRLPGQFHFGPWYHSDRFDDVTPGSSATFAGNYGAQCEVEQMLYKESSGNEEDDQGLGAFAQYGWAPEDRNQAHQYVGGGLLYRGLLPGRDGDLLGIGVAHLIFSGRLPDASSETAVELFCRAQLSRRTMIQPDLQYLANPGGNGRDALVFGLRFETAL